MMKDILIDIMHFALKWIIPDIILLTIAFGIYRKKAYHTKKGSNVADEEDQINHTQKERLIRILYLAEKINQSFNKYLLYLYDTSSRNRFDQLVENLNNLLTDLYHEQRLANLYLPKDQQKILEELLTMATGVVAEMSTNSTNAANQITKYNQHIDLSLKDNENKIFHYNEAIKCNRKLQNMQNKKLLLSDDYALAIQNYANWLGEYIKQNMKVVK